MAGHNWFNGNQLELLHLQCNRFKFEQARAQQPWSKYYRCFINFLGHMENPFNPSWSFRKHRWSFRKHRWSWHGRIFLFSFGIFINFLIIRGYTLFVCRTCHIRRAISCYVLNLASDRKYLRDLKGVSEHEFSTFFDFYITCFLLKESNVWLILLILVIGVVIFVITILWISMQLYLQLSFIRQLKVMKGIPIMN